LLSLSTQTGWEVKKCVRKKKEKRKKRKRNGKRKSGKKTIMYQKPFAFFLT
jgi:ribosomal protein L23